MERDDSQTNGRDIASYTIKKFKLTKLHVDEGGSLSYREA